MSGLSEDELRILDAFEGKEYTKRSVVAQTHSGSTDMRATMYEWNAQVGDHLTSEAWDPESFRQHIPEYTAMCRKWLHDRGTPWKQWK